MEAARRAPLELGLAILDEPTCRLVPRVAAAGDKGGVHDLVVEIGSPSGVAGIIALTRIVSLWLARDRRRTLTITSTGTGTDDATSVTVTGENVALSTIETAVRQMLTAEPTQDREPDPDSFPPSPDVGDGGTAGEARS